MITKSRTRTAMVVSSGLFLGLAPACGGDDSSQEASGGAGGTLQDASTGTAGGRAGTPGGGGTPGVGGTDSGGGSAGDGSAASIASIIPANRRIDWTGVGVPGGIPKWTNVCATIDALAYGNGTTDASGAIQSAIDACVTSETAPGVVSLPAGRYVLGSAISLKTKSYIVIRGAGADQTVVLSAGATFSFGVNGLTSLATPITAGNAIGSTEITLSKTDGLAAGQLIDIAEDNEPDLVFTNHGSTRDLKQMAMITAVSGNKLTITPGLIWTFSQNPVVLYSFPYVERFAGIEDMTIDHAAGGSGTSFDIDQCYGCWVKGIRSHKPGGYHSMIIDSANCEVRDSYFDDSQSYGPNNGAVTLRGSMNAGVVQGAVTGVAIENNIFDRSFPGVELQNASSGNYVGYNYGYAVQTSPEPDVTSSGMFNDNHGPHDMMNLFEGNVGEMFISDGYFGSGSHTTLFRNFFTGLNPRYQVSLWSIALDRWAYYYNVVGNVLGVPTPKPKLYEMTAENCPGGPSVYRLGYPNMGNCGFTPYDGKGPTGPDPKVISTLLRWGNFDANGDAVRWDALEIPSGVQVPTTQGLPASLHHGGKPAWWPASVAWPPIGPDVSGGQNGSGHANKIPAEVCFEKQSLLTGGTFARGTCYGP